MNSKENNGIRTHTWEQVAMTFIDRVYSLIKNGHIISASIFVVLAIIFLFVYKYPSDKLPELTMAFGGFLNSEKYWIIPATFLTMVLLCTIIVGFKAYKAEVRRVSKQRKDIIHGIKNKELREIPDHNTSEIDISSLSIETITSEGT